MKIAVNRCYGGFSLSEKALCRLAELKGVTLYPEENNFGSKTYWTVPEKPEGILEDDEFHKYSMEDRQRSNRIWDENTFCDWKRTKKRTDPDLIKVIEELGEYANGGFAEIEIVEIPDDVEWQIEEYDGREWVAESHRTW